MSTQWRGEVVDAVVEVCGITPDVLVDDADLDTIGIDSLDLIEVGMIIEERHDVQLSGDDFEGVTTFGGAVGVFEGILEAKQQAQ